MCKDIIRLLEEHRLKEAIAQLLSVARETENWELQTDIDNLQTTYAYLLQYAEQGTPDPERKQQYQLLYRSLYEMADRADYCLRVKTEKSFFTEALSRSCDLLSPEFEEMSETLDSYTSDVAVAGLSAEGTKKAEEGIVALRRRRQKTVDRIFDSVWTSSVWGEGECINAMGLYYMPSARQEDISVLVSAVTLGLLRMFDWRKYLFLLEAYRYYASDMAGQRALVGVALATYYHEERLKMYPELIERFYEYAKGVKFFKKELMDIQTAFLFTRETGKIEQRMKDEIIPDLKGTHSVRTDELTPENLDELLEKNPEWKERISRLEAKMDELNDLQSSGADLYMATFSQLKNFPFFMYVAHWFYPFYKDNQEISPLFPIGSEKKPAIIDYMVATRYICNSDKYSLCLSFMSDPQSRDLVTNPITDRDELQVSAELLRLDGATSEKASTVESRMYVQDLYRFFKLWRGKAEVHDIFADSLAFWKNSILKPFFDTKKTMLEIADWLFSKDYLDEAAEIYKSLSVKTDLDVDAWQKLAYVLQRNKKYEEAIEAYRKADMIDSDNPWVVGHLAHCCKRAGNYPEAVDCYKRLETLAPDNLQNTYRMGQCYMLMQEYGKALACFFKVEYLGMSTDVVWRSIAWCQFMSDKYGDAVQSYGKLTRTDGVKPADWLNFGHACLVQGKMTEALVCYRNVRKECGSHDEFLRLYMADKQILRDKGVEEENIYIVPDML